MSTRDYSTILGLVAAITLMVIAILIGGDNGKSSPAGFIEIRSMLIVVGGTLFITIACFSIRQFWQSLGVVGRSMFNTVLPGAQAASIILETATVARKDGILELQNNKHLFRHSRFFREGVQMLIDGMDEEEVHRVLKDEVHAFLARYRSAYSMMNKAAEVSPAMGLIGTLIGLVQMLGNLSDPSSIGPAMAVALLTTFYGAVLSYMIFMPLASKIDRNSKLEAVNLHIYETGIISIMKKESPRRLEMYINAALEPDKRINYFEKI